MPGARMLNRRAANSARMEGQAWQADLSALDKRGPLAGEGDRARGMRAGHAPSARWILIRVDDDRQMRLIESHLGGLRSATSIRVKRPARDTTRFPAGMPPLIRAHSWRRALRRTGEHR